MRFKEMFELVHESVMEEQAELVNITNPFFWADTVPEALMEMQEEIGRIAAGGFLVGLDFALQMIRAHGVPEDLEAMLEKRE